MSYIKTNWLPRIRQYANRLRLTPVAGGAVVDYDVTQVEGTITQAGTALGPTNMNHIEDGLVAHQALVATDVELGHIKVGAFASGTGLELNANNEISMEDRPGGCLGTTEYTDTYPTVFSATEKIPTNRTFYPFRLLIVILRNKSDLAKFIKFEVDPYTGIGIATGVNSSGKVITVRTSTTTIHGTTSAVNTIGYGVAGTNIVSITLKEMLETGDDAGNIRILLAGTESVSQSLNVYVDWMLV